MSQAALRIENLSKRYRIGGSVAAAPYRTFREALVDAAAIPVRRFRRRSKEDSAAQAIWALKDVSFTVAPGETVGVIGRNGAGKSTLLKILSGITEPTGGRALVRGRVAALIEVGAGFHPELNGRENIYLSGAILGMTRHEIRRKFDEIVAFAEVERFIDTPVKRYSSGMYMRLAFAVAAHLEPEILLVDEVLAVGDTEFQKKCLGKMEDVAATEGRAVLFVSHNLHAVALLCQSVVRLHEGELVEHGPTREVVERYLSSNAREEGERRWSPEEAPGNEMVQLRAVRVASRRADAAADFSMGVDGGKVARSAGSLPPSSVTTSEPFSLEIEFCCLRAMKVTPSFHIYNSHGMLLFSTANLHDQEWGAAVYPPGLYRCSCTVPACLLNEGQYHVSAFLSRDTDGWAHVHVPMAIAFRVTDDGAGRGPYVGEWPGLIRPLLTWEGRRIGDLASAVGCRLSAVSGKSGAVSTDSRQPTADS